MLCDLFGRVVMQWSGGQLLSQPRLTLSLRSMGLSRGAYMLRIRGADLRIDRRVVIR
jgi:hypothetical protein